MSIPMCKKCKKTINEVNLSRINKTGVKSEWGCEECFDFSRPKEVEEILSIISDKK